MKKSKASNQSRGVGEIIAHLESLGSPARRKSLSRVGGPSNSTLGVSTKDVRQLGKELGKNQELARSLWDTGIHEARLLAVLVAEPSKMTVSDIEKWLRDVETWDLCDHLCNNLARSVPKVKSHLALWAESPREFTKRAAFSTIASLVIHDPHLSDEEINEYLELIRTHADDKRNYVKKSISWALREIGKRNYDCHILALDLARELSDSESTAARWIGKDAISELVTLVAVPERQRLLTSNSKMGAKAERKSKRK